MITIIKRLFEEVFNKNIDLYNEHIDMIRYEYNKIINVLSKSISIDETRFEVHKLVGVLGNLMITSSYELIYWCKLLLLLDKNDLNIKFNSYKTYIQKIIEFDKSNIGL